MSLTYASFPGGIEGVRADVRENRAALGRVVRYFVEDAGITQFLDMEPGVVQAAQWRPDPGAATLTSQVWLGVGRKAD